jgi:hypothetical protein
MSLIHEALKRAAREGETDLISQRPRKLHISIRSFPALRAILLFALILLVGGGGMGLYLQRFSTAARKAVPTLVSPAGTEARPAAPSKGASDVTAVPVQPLETPKKIQPSTIVEQPPNESALVHLRRAQEFVDTGMFQEAEREYRKAVQLEPDNAVIRNNLGRVLAELGRVNEAEREYHTALKLDAQYTPSLNNLALLFDRQNRFDEAIRLYEEALRLDRTYAEAHLNYASVLERWGYPERAREHYEAFLSHATGKSRNMIPVVRKHLAAQP